MPDDYEKTFWEEIWGCVNYIKLPYETVMSMPVQHRKIWIQRHNHEAEITKNMMENPNNGHSIDGESINAYAELEQKKEH